MNKKQIGISVVSIKKEDCCGCAACEAICPVDAIKVALDEYGFYYPEVDQMQCIECGKCMHVCSFSK